MENKIVYENDTLDTIFYALTKFQQGYKEKPFKGMSLSHRGLLIESRQGQVFEIVLKEITRDEK